MAVLARRAMSTGLGVGGKIVKLAMLAHGSLGGGMGMIEILRPALRVIDVAGRVMVEFVERTLVAQQTADAKGIDWRL